MDDETARTLLATERARIEAELADVTGAGAQDRETANEAGPYDEPAERLIAEEGDDAVAASLRRRLDQIDRAERRLAEGTYGRSVNSGAPIEDDRLEADPAAELTAEEARTAG
jgi:DnaK suppressor protein